MNMNECFPLINSLSLSLMFADKELYGSSHMNCVFIEFASKLCFTTIYWFTDNIQTESNLNTKFTMDSQGSGWEISEAVNEKRMQYSMKIE